MKEKSLIKLKFLMLNVYYIKIEVENMILNVYIAKRVFNEILHNDVFTIHY